MAARNVESAAYDHRARKQKPTLRSMSLRRSANGGFIAEHDMQSGGEGPWIPPQVHTFEKGAEFLAHVAKHMGIPGAAEEAGEKEHS